MESLCREKKAITEFADDIINYEVTGCINDTPYLILSYVKNVLSLSVREKIAICYGNSLANYLDNCIVSVVDIDIVMFYC